VFAGRLNVLELQPLLNVDLSHIERHVEELVRRERSVQLVDGELITSYYQDGVAEEINEALHDAGHVSLAALARRFNVSTEFIVQLVTRRLGRHIHGQLDGDTLYTHHFVERHRAQLRGVLAAITRPTPISAILAAHPDGFNEHLFYSCVPTRPPAITPGWLHRPSAAAPSLSHPTKFIDSLFCSCH